MEEKQHENSHHEGVSVKIGAHRQRGKQMQKGGDVSDLKPFLGDKFGTIGPDTDGGEVPSGVRA
jgi:hypothetical protein